MDNRFLHTKQAGLRITYKYLEVIFFYKSKFWRWIFLNRSAEFPNTAFSYFWFTKYKISIFALPVMLISVVHLLDFIDYDTTGELLFPRCAECTIFADSEMC